MSPTPLSLAQLPSDQRRCLRIVSAVPDVAHAARKLQIIGDNLDRRTHRAAPFMTKHDDQRHAELRHRKLD